MVSPLWVRGSQRRIMVGTAAVVAMLFALTACTPQPSIAGTVTNANGGGPAAGVEVAVYADASETLVSRTYTDASGNYGIAGLTAGTYRVRMSDSAWFQDAADWASATPVDVTADGTTTVSAAIVPTTGSLSGTATDADLVPLASVTVAALNAVTGKTIATTTTDATGTYAFPELASAPYRVRFAKSGYGTVFSGGAIGFSVAPTIEVTAGSSASAVDGALAPQARLWGRVTNGHVGIGGLAVFATSGPDTVATTTTKDDGTFVVSGLPAGTFRLQISDVTGAYRNEYWGTTGMTAVQSPTFAVTSGESVSAGTNVVAGHDCDPAVLHPGATLAGADLTEKALAGCIVAGADLSRARLTGSDLEGADLSTANVAGADLTNATIRGANLFGATGLPSTVGLTSTAANGWSDTTFFDSDLSLAGADLSGADLSRVVMASSTYVTGVDLSAASFAGADLTGAVLMGADLTGTDIAGADLTDANLVLAVGTPVGYTTATFANTTCPTSANSDVVSGTCGGEPWMCATPSCYPEDHCPSITPEGWWGDVDRQSVTFSGQLGPVLGTVFRPTDTTTYPGPRPAVTIVPGYDQPECYQWWSAWTLAARGYVTLTFTPTVPASAGIDLESAIDFLESTDNPYAAATDASRLAVAGHSAGAAYAAEAQATDPRIDAVVAWGGLDNTATPQVPLLVMTSDTWYGPGPAPGSADGKLVTPNRWLTAGIPTAGYSLAGTVHEDFQTNGSPAAHPRILHATLAWLDRWIAGDDTAISRLATSTWGTELRSDVLSTYYTSMVATPEYTCLDLDLC